MKEKWLFVSLMLLSIGLTLTGCMTAQTARPKGFQETRSTRAELEESFAPQRWAVVVGVPSYRDPTWSRLRFTTNDADEVARVLKSPHYGAFHRIILLTTEELTSRESILTELRRLRSDLRRQDTLVFYFSGHGSLELNADGSPNFYLATSDSRSNDLWGTGIELNALREFLDDLKPQRKVMILDNCFSGQGKSRVASATKARLAGMADPFKGGGQMFGRSEAVLMASTFGGTAMEEDRLGNGTYTHFLLQALTSSSTAADVNQDGAVTAYEAHDYARKHTVEHTTGAQVPEGFFRVLGQAEIYLSGKPGPELAKASALVYAYGLSPGSSVTMSVDGRLKGTFPQTLAVEPGLHRLTVRDLSGRVLADGEAELKRGEVYPLGTLLEELQGYRRFFTLSLGGQAQQGFLTPIWGEQGLRVGLSTGLRVRSGALAGLTASFGGGWTGIESGDWRAYSSDEHRSVFDLQSTWVYRRRLGPVQLGAGWQVQGNFTTAVAASENAGAVAPETLRLLDRWLTVQTGPVLWQGLALQRNLLLRMEEQGAWTYGSLDSIQSDSNLQFGMSMGLEMGF